MGKKLYFSGLDGLRFISISFVVLHHLFTFRNYYSDQRFEVPVLGQIGYYGIQFFFAGSGFLITYLLLTEFQKNGRISLKHFYLRRILRIWPAYYLLIILALIVLISVPFFYIPQITDAYLQADYKKADLLYFSFLPHIAGLYYPTGPFVHQTYTIGIEEQFYFIWGILFLLFPKQAKWIFVAMVIAIPVLAFLQDQLQSTGSSLKGVSYIRYCRFSTFAIGSLWAYAFFNGQKWTGVFSNVMVQLLVYAILVLSIAFDFSIPYFRDEYIAIVTLCVFSVATFKEKSLINYEAKWLSFLGRISYGIYLFHIFAIVIAVKIYTYIFGSGVAWWQLVILSLLTLGLSVLFGWISYHSVEQFFLRIKKRLSKV